MKLATGRKLIASCMSFLCWQEIESEAQVLEKGLEQRARVLELGLEKEAGIVEQGLETSLESGLRSFGKGFTVVEKDIASLEAQLEKELSAVGRKGSAMPSTHLAQLLTTM